MGWSATASTVRVRPQAVLRVSLRERSPWSPSALDRVAHSCRSCTVTHAAALKRARAQYPTRLGAFFSTTTRSLTTTIESYNV